MPDAAMTKSFLLWTFCRQCTLIKNAVGFKDHKMKRKEKRSYHMANALAHEIVIKEQKVKSTNGKEKGGKKALNTSSLG